MCCVLSLCCQLYSTQRNPGQFTWPKLSLNAYMMRHLRHILGVKVWHRIPNQDILMKTNMSSMYETLIHRLIWAGHLIRLNNTPLPKQIFPAQGRTSKRWQAKTRFKDAINTSLPWKGIPPGSWDKKANNRLLWRELVWREVVIGWTASSSTNYNPKQSTSNSEHLHAGTCRTSPWGWFSVMNNEQCSAVLHGWLCEVDSPLSMFHLWGYFMVQSMLHVVLQRPLSHNSPKTK